MAARGLPDEPSIRLHPQDHAALRAAQSFDVIARLEVAARAESFDDGHHRIAIQHAGNVVGNRRGGFAATAQRKFSEDEVGGHTPDVGEGVAVEEKERRPAMALPEKIKRLIEGQDFGLFASPLCFNRSKAL